MSEFKAYRIQERDGKVVAGFEQLTLDALTPGDVVIRVQYSSINYKDALAATGTGKILRKFPLNGGIDLSGEVVSSEDARYKPGQKVTGKVTKLTNFGVFVELEPGLEGLLHISELTEDNIESPEEVVKVGDDVEVKVLRVDAKDRKIGLSRKNVDDPTVPDEISEEVMGGGEVARQQKKEEAKRELRGGTGAAGPLIQMPESDEGAS